MVLTLKKKISLCLAIMMLLALFAGCHGDTEIVSETASIDFESQAHIQAGTSDDSSISEEESQPPITGDFVVNEKKYDYNGNNIELLHVENQTNRHYDIAIKGKYLDKDGNVIKEETQEFPAFPSGWSNYFIFYPECAFDSFTYELKTEEYSKEVPDAIDNRIICKLTDSEGNPLASYIDYSYDKKLKWQRRVLGLTSGDQPDIIEGRALCFDMILDNRHSAITISSSFKLLIFDINGNVYTIYSEGTNADHVGGPRDGKGSCPIDLLKQPRGDEEIVPDILKDFTVIVAVTKVMDEEDFMEQALKLAGMTK